MSIEKEPNFQRLVFVSALLHLLFITFVFIPFKTREGEFRSYYVNLVAPLEIHREEGTPVTKKAEERIASKEKTIKEKITPEQKTTKAKSKTDSEMSLESAERITKEVERIRAISALSKSREETEKTEEIEIIRKRVYEASSGSSGIPNRGEQAGSDSYYALITEKIWSHWVYPDFELAGLEVIVSIKIDSKGNVLSHVIEKSSGNVLFDRSAVRAVSKASPLPPPPVEMEVGVRFYL